MSLDQSLGQLRHLFAQMKQGKVLDPRQAADGLLSPVIADLERQRDTLNADLATARQEVERVTRERDEAVRCPCGCGMEMIVERPCLLHGTHTSGECAAIGRVQAAESALATERERSEGLREALREIAEELEIQARCDAYSGAWRPSVRSAAVRLRALLSTPEPQDTQNQEDDHV